MTLNTLYSSEATAGEAPVNPNALNMRDQAEEVVGLLVFGKKGEAACAITQK